MIIAGLQGTLCRSSWEAEAAEEFRRQRIVGVPGASRISFWKKDVINGLKYSILSSFCIFYTLIITYHFFLLYFVSRRNSNSWQEGLESNHENRCLVGTCRPWVRTHQKPISANDDDRPLEFPWQFRMVCLALRRILPRNGSKRESITDIFCSVYAWA